MTNNQRARLWDEINRYVATCGGDASKHVYGNTPRQVAVSQIEAIIREVEAAWANDMRKVAEARMADLDDQAERELARLRSDLDAARLKWSELQHDAHRWAHAATIQQQEIDRLRARLPSEAELEAFRFVCGREWPWDVDDYKDAAESWLARQENDNAD